jgi:two-component system, OmpR family, response regulator
MHEQPEVLVIEDETALRETMVSYLKLDGFSAMGVGTLAAASQWVETHAVDLLVLDLGLPDGDGIAWLQEHPSLLEHGVIITTARGSRDDRVGGARAGADSYLVKPVELEELALLLWNLVRRVRDVTPASWVLDQISWTLIAPNGAPIRLTHSEAVIMRAFAEQPGHTISRRALIERLGDDPDAYDLRRMEVLVRRLRQKVERTAGHPLPLETAHAVGYAFVAPISVRHGLASP